MRMMLNLVVVSCAANSVLGAEPFAWRTAAPESQGMSSANLDALQQDLAERRTRAFLVVRNDRIVHEWYAEGQTAQTKQGTASLAKAIVGGLSLAVAINDGRMALDDPASRWVPQWKGDPRKSQITVRHLGSHTSGIDDSHNREEQARGIDQGSYTGWTGEFWRWRNGKQRPPDDAFSISRDVAPLLFDPGTDFQYSNPGLAMLGYCVTASLKGTPHSDIRALLRERIMRPIGVPDGEWSCGYGLTEEVEGLPMVANWGGGSYTPRAVARIGRLVLRRGDWEGERLLSAKAVEDMTRDAGLPGHCGMGWWTNGDGRFPDVPKDAVWGAGAGHQILLVVPSLQLIMVRNGNDLYPRSEARERIAEVLFEPLIAAVTGRTERVVIDSVPEGKAPYPPSRVITGIDWAPRKRSGATRTAATTGLSHGRTTGTCTARTETATASRPTSNAS
jgi:CubicO group peptidase (beta-lactamase class C family)